MNNKHHHTQPHMPVLLEQVLHTLAPAKGESYLDLTAGYGGHARAVIEHTMFPERVTLVDRDQSALDSLGDLQEKGASLVHSDFGSACKQLASENMSYDMILMDLGVSSPHLDIPERGFSFMRDGPLDMRMDQSSGITAADIVNNSSEEELIAILRKYGEEPRAKQIAKAITTERPFETTKQLADAVENSSRRPRGKTHPATRTFQAIRMAVNQELEQVEMALSHVETLLKPNGRVAVISFHSLEDRIVKNYFNEKAKSGYESTMKLITKKPILGTIESVNNPRSRSAVLRVAQLN